jgi:hypothetical protein
MMTIFGKHGHNIIKHTMRRTMSMTPKPPINNDKYLDITVGFISGSIAGVMFSTIDNDSIFLPLGALHITYLASQTPGIFKPHLICCIGSIGMIVFLRNKYLHNHI